MTFKASRRQLTEKETAWLVKHFCHTKNADIMARLGINHSHLHDIANELGLKKTRQFMRKVATANSMLAKKEWERIKAEEPERYERQRRQMEENTKPMRGKWTWGDYLKRETKRQKAERMEKRRASLERKRERDRVRVAMGLEPLTRLPLGVVSKNRTRFYHAKHHLMYRYGYEMGEGATMYITDKTRRTKCEAYYTERYRMKFVVKGEDNHTARAVRLPPDWSDKQGGIASY